MSQHKRVCPYCDRIFPGWYWGVSGKAGGCGTIQIPGLARANFERHKSACARKMRSSFPEPFEEMLHRLHIEYNQAIRRGAEKDELKRRIATINRAKQEKPGPGGFGTIWPERWGEKLARGFAMCSCDSQTKSGASQWICNYHGRQPDTFFRTKKESSDGT